MIVAICDIWDMYDQGEVVCITTNGFITRGGNAVMGRGVAAQAAKRNPHLKRSLGLLIMENGNVVQRIDHNLVSFPVKPQLGICNADKSNVVRHMRRQYKPFGWVPGWAMMGDMHLIERSLWELRQLHSYGFFKRVYLPKPGCGAGGLEWSEVKPLCEQYSNGGAEWLVVCDLT